MGENWRSGVLYTLGVCQLLGSFRQEVDRTWVAFDGRVALNGFASRRREAIWFRRQGALSNIGNDAILTRA